MSGIEIPNNMGRASHASCCLDMFRLYDGLVGLMRWPDSIDAMAWLKTQGTELDVCNVLKQG